jgi:hypothetical protein
MSNKSELRPTNFVIVVDFDPKNTYLDSQSLLGWDNDTDWFDHYTDGDEIITSKNNIKKNKWSLIQIGSVGLYVGEKQSNVQDYSDSGNREGYDCTVCKLEKDSNDEWRVVPV